MGRTDEGREGPYLKNQPEEGGEEGGGAGREERESAPAMTPAPSAAGRSMTFAAPQYPSI